MSKTPQYYNKELLELNTRYELILNQVTNTYPKAKAYSEIKSYEKIYENKQSKLDELNSDFFLFRNSIEKDISSLNKNIIIANNKIKIIEEDNKKLTAELKNLENQKEGAIGLYDDTQYWYNFSKTENIIYFLALCGIGYGIYINKK